jgi:hypothetical protein
MDEGGDTSPSEPRSSLNGFFVMVDEIFSRRQRYIETRQ